MLIRNVRRGVPPPPSPTREGFVGRECFFGRRATLARDCLFRRARGQRLIRGVLPPRKGAARRETGSSRWDSSLTHARAPQRRSCGRFPSVRLLVKQAVTDQRNRMDKPDPRLRLSANGH
jgi:hypothetical protein